MPKNILITGGLGFIGSNLAHKCVSEGHNVTLLSQSDKKLKNIQGIEERVTVVIKDIKNISKEDVANKDWIFHCASTVHNYNIQDNPTLDIDVNCTGTIKLLEACRHNNINAKIIYPSTFFVNGKLDKLPATPESPCNPLGLYPTTRLAGEHFCRNYNEVFGMNSIIARLANVFGIREQRDNNKKAAFNRMINLASQNKTIDLYDNGIIKRDYIYIEDVVDALLVIARNGERGGVYYVGRGEGTPFKNMVDMIIEEAGAGRINPIEPPKFHKASGINDFWCDNTPLRGLGWAPRVSLREGIRKTLEEYRGQDERK